MKSTWSASRWWQGRVSIVNNTGKGMRLMFRSDEGLLGFDLPSGGREDLFCKKKTSFTILDSNDKNVALVWKVLASPGRKLVLDKDDHASAVAFSLLFDKISGPMVSLSHPTPAALCTGTQVYEEDFRI